MRHLSPLSMIALVLLAGCEREPPPPPEPEGPPPKTANEIYSDYRAAVKPLIDGAGPQGQIGYGQADPIVSEFTKVRGQNRSEINEPEAAGKIESDVSAAIPKARDNEQWYAVDGLLKLHALLNPNSQRHQPLRRRADLMLARPWVKVTGFAEIDPGDLVTFMTVTDPKTRESESLKVREGEEFFPGADDKPVLRLIRVIGAQSGVELEYLRLPGHTWEVPGPDSR